jgi:hypothetical protein
VGFTEKGNILDLTPTLSEGEGVKEVKASSQPFSKREGLKEGSMPIKSHLLWRGFR